MSRARWSLILVLALIVGAIVLIQQPWRPRAMLPAPPGIETVQVGTQPGLVAPDFELEHMRTGEKVRLSSLQGGAVFLNFWASWCPPCREEMPDIERVHQEFKDRGLVVLAVNRAEPKAAALGYIDQELGGRISYTLLADPRDDVYNVYVSRGMPASFFLDREGRITARHIGLIPYETMREEALKALGERP